MIRKIKDKSDVVRCAEINVFNNRLYYYPIFNDINFSFKYYNVEHVFNEYNDDVNFMNNTYVYDDEGIVKGYIYIYNQEIIKLYVDSFFQNQGIGQELIDYAIKQLAVKRVLCLEKNVKARKFYERNGFEYTGQKQLEEGTSEYLLLLERKQR